MGSQSIQSVIRGLMHYNVLFLLLISTATFAQFYDVPLFTPMYPPYGYTYPSTPPEPEEDLEKDRAVYHSRYENEYTALPDTGEEPDYYTIDCPPIKPYGDIEIVIMDYDD